MHHPGQQVVDSNGLTVREHFLVPMHHLVERITPPPRGSATAAGRQCSWPDAPGPVPSETAPSILGPWRPRGCIFYSIHTQDIGQGKNREYGPSGGLLGHTVGYDGCLLVHRGEEAPKVPCWGAPHMHPLIAGRRPYWDTRPR